tara:strand:- start:7800 stop:8480 length:681 start_codon:yes stop_codon:yes gene_type:complete
VVNSLIRYYDGRLTREFCRTLISKFEHHSDHHRDGRISSRGSLIGKFSDKKVTQQLWIEHATVVHNWRDELNTIRSACIDCIKEYITDDEIEDHPLKFYENLVFEQIRLKRYDKNIGKHDWHSDNTAPSSFSRLLAMQIYFNDVSEGGETEFKSWDSNINNLKIEPVAGRIVLFPTSWPFYHRGCTPISNAKYSANAYLRIDPSLFASDMNKYNQQYDTANRVYHN